MTVLEQLSQFEPNLSGKAETNAKYIAKGTAVFKEPTCSLTNKLFHRNSMIIKAKAIERPLVHNMIGVCLPQFPKGQLSRCNTTIATLNQSFLLHVNIGHLFLERIGA